jgi:chromate transporter
MIFWRLFYTFCKIGIFNFGGGYAMIALIQNEVVEKQAWMTTQEFTDIVAVSQMTPGPIGINVATYAGYTVVVNAGYDAWMGVAGAFLASFAVILLPFILLLALSHFLLKHKENKDLNNVFSTLRITVLGLIAAAALLLATPDNFGSLSETPVRFFISIAIFLIVFLLSLKKKISPILLILLSGVIGGIVYGVC